MKRLSFSRIMFMIKHTLRLLVLLCLASLKNKIAQDFEKLFIHEIKTARKIENLLSAK